ATGSRVIKPSIRPGQTDKSMEAKRLERRHQLEMRGLKEADQRARQALIKSKGLQGATGSRVIKPSISLGQTDKSMEAKRLERRHQLEMRGLKEADQRARQALIKSRGVQGATGSRVIKPSISLGQTDKSMEAKRLERRHQL